MQLIAIAKELAVATLLGILLGAGSAWTIQGWRIDAIRADFESDKAKAVQQEKGRADQIGNDYAAVVDYLNEQKRARTITVVKELEKPIYRDPVCAIPESGRVLVNDAIRQANAARLGNAVLPAHSSTARESNAGRSPSVVDMGGRGLRGMLGWKSGIDQVGD